MGLRARVIVLVVGLVAIVHMAWGVSDVQDDARLLRSEAERRGMEVLRALSIPCSVSLANREIETLDAVLARFAAEEGRDLDVLWISILDTQGVIVAHTDPLEFGRRPSDSFTASALAADRASSLEVDDAHGPRLLLTMPIVSGLRWGTATAAISLRGVEARIDRNRGRALFLSIALALALGAVLSLLLGRLVLEPLRLLTDTARRISDGELGARVPDHARGEEMVLLGRVFNEMAEEIQGQTARLERLVADRTRELEAANSELGEVVSELERLARTDGLTGLRNHRAFQEALSFEVRRANRLKQPLSLLMIDVDHFKTYNDAHGHPAGDHVLKRVAHIFTETLRSIDLVARYGGEEFSVLLLDTSTEAARSVGEKLRQAVRSYEFPLADESQEKGRITVSVGLATLPDHASDAADLLERADATLYEAKRAGRDTVHIHGTRESGSKSTGQESTGQENTGEEST